MSDSHPRTLLLAHDFPPMPGGIARALGEIARHAPEGRWMVSTARLPDSAVVDAQLGCPVDRLPFEPKRLRTMPGLLCWAVQAGRLARRHRTEFVWAGNLKPAGHVARWLGARRRLAYGLIVYGLDLQRLAEQVALQPAKRRAAAGIIAGAAGTVAISEWTAGRFREVAGTLDLPAAAARVRVVRPGVDAERFRPGIPTDAVRSRHDLDARPWLLTVARLVPHKGVDHALAALARLRDEGIDVGYLVAGEGPAGPALRAQAAHLGLAERVRFLGAVPEADLPALYNVAAVYVGLSGQRGLEVEGFGLSLLEAAACGLPVLAGRGGGTGDAVAEGITGHLVDPASADVAVGALRDLLQDPSRRRAMGDAGRARVERDFSWERVVRDLGQAARQFRAGVGPPGGR